MFGSSFSFHSSSNTGSVWDVERWDIWHRSHVTILSKVFMLLMCHYDFRASLMRSCLVVICDFSASFVSSLFPICIVKTFAVLASLVCQGFLSLWVVCVVCRVCLCHFPKSCSSPLWSSSDLQCGGMDVVKSRRNEGTLI